MHFIHHIPFLVPIGWIGFDFSVQTPSASAPLSALPRHADVPTHGNALVGDRSGASTSVPTVDEHGDALDHGAERRLPHARPMTADATLVST
jgi:hypothetical protein